MFYMNINEVRVGDRVGYRDTTMPLGSDMIRRATVTKVGRKYVHIALDRAVYGGTCRKLIGNVTTDQAVFPATLFRVND